MAFSLLTALLRSLQKGLKLAKRGEEARGQSSRCSFLVDTALNRGQTENGSFLALLAKMNCPGNTVLSLYLVFFSSQYKALARNISG